MKNSVFLKIIASYLFITLIASCRKHGCMDSNANNYSSSANKDDGTCYYDGNVTFWFGKATSDSLLAKGSNSLTIYVDGSIIGSCQSTNFLSSAPSCNQTGLITSKKYCGGMMESKSYSFMVKDNNNITCWQGNIDFESNECKLFELQK